VVPDLPVASVGQYAVIPEGHVGHTWDAKQKRLKTTKSVTEISSVAQEATKNQRERWGKCNDQHFGLKPLSSN
jgi:hypothetical protein